MKIRGKFDEALELYSKAISLDKNCVNAYLNRGRLRILNKSPSI